MLQIYYLTTNAALRRVPIFLVSSSDGMTPATDQAGGQPQIQTNFGSWVNTAATLVGGTDGAYYVELSASEIATFGVALIKYKGATTAQCAVPVQFVAFNPYEPHCLGLDYLTWLGSAVAELTVPPTATPTPVQILSFLNMVMRCRRRTIAGYQEMYNDAGLVLARWPVSDSGTELNVSKIESP